MYQGGHDAVRVRQVMVPLAILIYGPPPIMPWPMVEARQILVGGLHCDLPAAICIDLRLAP